MKKKLPLVIVCATIILLACVLLRTKSVKNAEQIGLKEIQSSTTKIVISVNDSPRETTDPQILDDVFSLLFDAHYAKAFFSDKVDGGIFIYWQDENGNNLMSLHQDQLKIGDKVYKVERDLKDDIADITGLHL